MFVIELNVVKSIDFLIILSSIVIIYLNDLRLWIVIYNNQR
jgi:hypothetical protein